MAATRFLVIPSFLPCNFFDFYLADKLNNVVKMTSKRRSSPSILFVIKHISKCFLIKTVMINYILVKIDHFKFHG